LILFFFAAAGEGEEVLNTLTWRGQNTIGKWSGGVRNFTKTEGDWPNGLGAVIAIGFAFLPSHSNSLCRPDGGKRIETIIIITKRRMSNWSVFELIIHLRNGTATQNPKETQ
tara:strand:+ start:620 stop:955 length:336 start_codon:yes stop_codon:yes gene_type:complete